MKIQTIQNIDEFVSIRDEWNCLLQSSSSDCIFLTHEWLSVWWRRLSEGRVLHIVTVRDDNGELAGVLPAAERMPQLSRMMPRVLELIGSGVIGSDYLDVIARKGCESPVAAALSDHLHRRGLMVQLSQLRGREHAATALAEQMRRRAWRTEESKLNVCPFIDLRGHTWDTYLDTLGASIRKNINRYLRNLPKSFDMRVACVRDPAEAQSALATTIDLHHKRWAAGRSEAFQTEPVVAFHREFVQLAAEQGWLRILILWLDGVPASALYGLRYGPTFYFYQSGFDPAYTKHSVGVATMGLAIKTAIEEGASEYDFLHGNEEYKFHWADGVRDLTRLELHPPHATGWIYQQAIGVNRAARRMAKRVLNKARHHAALNC